MTREDKTRLERMSEEVEFITKTTAGVSEACFLDDSLLQHGICMSIITIGECANQLSDEFTEKYAEIPWVQIVAVRNIAAHTYQQLDMRQIWKAVILDIPKLREFLSDFV